MRNSDKGPLSYLSLKPPQLPHQQMKFATFYHKFNLNLKRLHKHFANAFPMTTLKDGENASVSLHLVIVLSFIASLRDKP